MKNFTSGLLLSTSSDNLPEGFTLSNRGLSPTAIKSFRSRFGSSLLASLNAHSIFYFADVFWYGVGTTLYRDTVDLSVTLSGDQLSFAKCPPVAGITDYLFLTGGGALYKATSAGVVQNWGIDIPASAPTAALDLSTYTSIVTAAFKWTLSTSGTGEYYVELAAGGDPSIAAPLAVIANSLQLTVGTLGALTTSQYAYGDNDTLGYNTIYVRLADSADPDGKATGYVKYLAATNGSLTADAVYSYLITYKNSTTGHRSNSNTTAASATPSGPNLAISLTAIPDGSAVDSQISTVEIWRTGPDGSLYFYLTSIAAGTTSYIDNGSITLSATELPTDNIKPYAYFDDCLGPYNASMFWITRTEDAQRGRVYYSCIGRVESMEGFIEVTNSSNPLQRLFRFQGQLGVIAESGIFLIGGDNPYVSREIPGCPGTSEPFSVIETPIGIVYQANDGIRLFDGNSSFLIALGSIERLFRGEALGDLLAFASPTYAGYARDEYYLSDNAQAIAVNKDGRVRDLGLGFRAFHYSPETDQLAITHSSTILDFEQPLLYADNHTAIPIILEPPHIAIDDNIRKMWHFVEIDCNTNNQDITLIAIADDIETTIGSFNTSTRQRRILPINLEVGTESGIRITGETHNYPLEIFSLTPTLLPFISLPFDSIDIIQYIALDINTNNEIITFNLIHDGITTPIGKFTTPSRRKVTLIPGIAGKEFSFTITGSTLANSIDIFSITFEFAKNGQKVII